MSGVVVVVSQAWFVFGVSLSEIDLEIGEAVGEVIAASGKEGITVVDVDLSDLGRLE